MKRQASIKNTASNAEVLPSRRKFLQVAAAAAAFTVVPRQVLGGPGQVAPNSKLTIAGVGLGGQGTQNIMAMIEYPEVQVVAVCDANRESTGYLSWNWTQGKDLRLCGREPARRAIDEFYAKKNPSGQQRGCRAYADYRELLEKEDVDGVMVATPDHTHAVISMAVLKRKKHLYCEKPLANTARETRLVTEAARQAGVATQLGNMGQAEESARVVQEILADGAIGAVREVNIWTPARFWEFPDWDGRPKTTPAVPEGLDWNLWLGPAPERPYHPAYHPWCWRNWRDFGTGLLGDLGCHKMSTVFKALQLGSPVSVEGSCTKVSPETWPLGEIVHFNFPARGKLPPVTIHWHDGGLQPPRPEGIDPEERVPDVLYIGEKGVLSGTRLRLLPDEKFKDYKHPAKTLPRSPGHYREWVEACLGGKPAGSNLPNHAGLLSEACMLGNIAARLQKKLLWDGAKFEFANDKEANKLLHREYRQGWSLT